MRSRDAHRVFGEFGIGGASNARLVKAPLVDTVFGYRIVLHLSCTYHDSLSL